MHGTSSVGHDQIKNLFSDGIAKVNIWTCLERDSSPVLFKDMVLNTAKIIGTSQTQQLINDALLGQKINKKSTPSLSHYTTVYRQDIIFNQMKQIALDYFKLWYR